MVPECLQMVSESYPELSRLCGWCSIPSGRSERHSRPMLRNMLQVLHVRRVALQRSEEQWSRLSIWSSQMRSEEDRLAGRSGLFVWGGIKPDRFQRHKKVPIELASWALEIGIGWGVRKIGLQGGPDSLFEGDKTCSIPKAQKSSYRDSWALEIGNREICFT